MFKKLIIFVAGVALGAYAMYNRLYKVAVGVMLRKEEEENKENVNEDE